MKLITAFELATKSENELRAKFREVSENLLCSEPNTPARCNAQATLENISQAIRTSSAATKVKRSDVFSTRR